MEKSEFDRLLAACEAVAEDAQGEAVFIGGIAVYLHAQRFVQSQELAETTHDADFYISQMGMSDLRDNHNIVANKRLGKSQLIEDGFEFDIYTEYQTNLCIPYSQIVAFSIEQPPFKIACLEHLLVLKMRACIDRQGSDKGRKDARDLVRILSIAYAQDNPFNVELIQAHWGEEEQSVLRSILKQGVALELAGGNAHKAKRINQECQKMVELLANSIAAPICPKPFK